jgi:hypothetical protein
MKVILTSPTNKEKTVELEAETVAIVNETFTEGKYINVIRITIKIDNGPSASINLLPEEFMRAAQLLS